MEPRRCGAAIGELVEEVHVVVGVRRSKAVEFGMRW
jgi:hypothetical protein